MFASDTTLADGRASGRLALAGACLAALFLSGADFLAAVLRMPFTATFLAGAVFAVTFLAGTRFPGATALASGLPTRFLAGAVFVFPAGFTLASLTRSSTTLRCRNSSLLLGPSSALRGSDPPLACDTHGAALRRELFGVEASGLVLRSFGTASSLGFAPTCRGQG